MLYFATPGVPRKTPGSGGTIKGLEYAHSLGLHAMEIEWVQRVPANKDHIALVGEKAKELGMHLTVHAPYFVNLNAADVSIIQKSKKRILDALAMAEVCGAISVCVHAAFYLKSTPQEALENVRRATDDILKHKQQLFPTVNLAYETMGKHSQFGTLEEVLTVSKEFDLYPCIDSAHIHARMNGAHNSVDEWNEMFDVYAKYLGKKSLNHMHLHYSGIAYTKKGERHHLPFQESDAAWIDFLHVLKDRKIGGILTCESPLMEDDTLLLQETYEKLK